MASNGWSGSSWINDNNQYDGGGVVPPSYTYSMSFSLASFQLNGNLQLSGSCAIDDDGKNPGYQRNTIEPVSWYDWPNSFTISYATNPTWFNAVQTVLQ